MRFSFHRFTLEQHIKRQRMVIHGFEARALKYIPKIIHRICERLLKLSGCGPEYSVDAEEATFTRSFLAFRYDDKGGGKLSGGFNKGQSPSESMAVTRRSSRSYLFSSADEDSMANSMSVSANSSGVPTPSYGGTRPGSETNSYVQSCSSALSGVDDTR